MRRRPGAVSATVKVEGGLRGVFTARIDSSTTLFDGLSAKALAMELDHDAVNSVVVLTLASVQSPPARTSGSYSFAKTPLKAAQAPLVMASISHFVLGVVGAILVLSLLALMNCRYE